MRAFAVLALLAAVLAPSALAAPRVTEKEATAVFLRQDKVADWLSRYPKKDRVVDAEYDRRRHTYTVHVWSGQAGEIAMGKVHDDGTVLETWTGPQVAWGMARGGRAAFGGKTLNSWPVWLGFCLVFLVGLADLRRPLSVRNLDLLVLVSFSASLWFFNRGDIFTSVPLLYPPLVYLLARAVWIAVRDRPSAGRTLWPVWLLAAATVFLVGFRVGLNVKTSNVIDVGYSGIVGAHRILHGEAPYGHFPVQNAVRPCGPPDGEGVVREWVQTNGHCEYENPNGDTYGPVAYEAYMPGYGIFGWSGKWPGDKLWAVHFTSILVDLLCVLGLALVGRRYGGNRLAVTLAFAWAAFPFTQYVSNSNTNDAIAPALLIWGFWLADTHWARGAFCALGGWTKFFSLPLVPLWASYPTRRLRTQALFLLGFAAATLAAFSVLLLEPNPLHAARVFWDRTLSWQLDRRSPFSLWDWGQYHAAGIPDLHVARRVLEGLLAAGGLAVFFVPRRKSPLQLAALTAAVLIGVELVLTHWFYPYIAWFFPFAAFMLLAFRPAPVLVARQEVDEHAPRALVAAG
jgi:hypothetical protein